MTLIRAGRRRVGGRFGGAAALAAALLGLGSVSGCGTNLNPGAAAVVNGNAITQDRVDSIVTAACASNSANAAAGQSGPAKSVANLRATVTSLLVQFEVTDDAASGLGLSVSQAAVSAGAAQFASQSPIPPSLDDTDADALKGYIAEAAKSSSQVQLIGAHLADPSITSSDQVKKDYSAQSTKYLQAYAAKQDVTVNPAYGRWTGSAVVGGSGSLSDPVSDIAKVGEAAASDSQASTSGLPASQVC